MNTNLFLFTGPETFLIHEQITAWKNAFKEKHGDMNLIRLDGEETGAGELIAQIEALPFLGEKRLIFIERLPPSPPARERDEDAPEKTEEKKEGKQERFIEFLDRVPETSVVVFVQPNPDKRKSLYKKIVQKGEIKEFNTLSSAELVQWIRNRAVKYKASLDPETADYLVSLIGQDLWRVDQEIQKLSLYCAGKPVDRSAIDEVTVPTIEANIFHLTDALGVKNGRQAIRNLHLSLGAGENLRQVFYMIVRQFRLFLQIGGYLMNYPNTSPANVAVSLKLHPFVARNTMSQMKRFKLSELKQAYQKLLEIDYALKTSRIRVTTENQDELAMAIERFILDFCQG